MAFSFKPALFNSARLGVARLASGALAMPWTRWAQLAACVVVAWVWIRHDPQHAAAAPMNQIADQSAAGGATGGHDPNVPGQDAVTSQSGAKTGAATPTITA